MSVFERKYGVALVGDKKISIPMLNVAGDDFLTGAEWTPAAGDVKIGVTNVATLPVFNATTLLWDYTLNSAEMSAAQIVVMIDDGEGIFDSFIVETFGGPEAEGETFVVPLASIKRALDIEQDDTIYDVRLVELENAAVAWFEEQTHRRFSVPRLRVERIRGRSHAILYLAGHIAGPAESDPEFVYVVVEERPIGGVEDDWETLEEGVDYERIDDAIHWTNRYVPHGWYSRMEYRITYLDGYHEPPKDVQAVILEILRGGYASWTDDGVTSEKIGDYSYSLGGGSSVTEGSLTGTSSSTLNRWKRKFA